MNKNKNRMPQIDDDNGMRNFVDEIDPILACKRFIIPIEELRGTNNMMIT